MIATNLTERETGAIAADFARWASARAESGGVSPRVAWVRPAPVEEPARLLERGGRVDVVLGGSPGSFRRLAEAGRLEPIGEADRVAWRVFREYEVGVSIDARREPAASDLHTSAIPTSAIPGRPGALALGDPRHDGPMLALAASMLEARGWPDGYAALVRAASKAVAIGRFGGSARARLDRGEVSGAIDVSTRTRPERVVFVPIATRQVEGVGLVRGARDPKWARLFVEFLAARGRAAPPVSEQLPGDPAAVALLADLLGATLVDAQDELIRARKALDRPGHATRSRAGADLESLLVQAPPWPPASVEALKAADPSGALVEALADQVAPDVETSVWLLESWKRPTGRIDGARIAALAVAADGRLMAEPRFRAWLRAEWTTWARQNYRRVAREAARPGGATS